MWSLFNDQKVRVRKENFKKKVKKDIIMFGTEALKQKMRDEEQEKKEYEALVREVVQDKIEGLKDKREEGKKILRRCNPNRLCQGDGIRSPLDLVTSVVCKFIMTTTQIDCYVM